MPADRAPSAADDGSHRVVAVGLRMVRVALREPFVSSHGVETDRLVVVVEVDAVDGGRGWGECSTLAAPTYTAEFTDGAFDALRDDLVPAWAELVRDAGAGTDDGRFFELARRHPMAASGLRMALLDLELRGRGRSLADHLGARRTEVAYTSVLGVGPHLGVDEVVDRGRAALAEGASMLKLKIRPGWDVVPLRALRTALGDVPIAADANGSYAAVGVSAELDAIGLVYLEQPLAADDLSGHAALAAGAHTPLALDESIVGLDSARRAIATGACRLINVKAARLGGVEEAAALIRTSHALGAIPFVGGMLELGVGRAAGVALAALAATVTHDAVPTDLGPTASYVSLDVTEPVVVGPLGGLVVPRGPGLGRTPEAGVLDAHTVRRHVVELA